MSSLYEKIESLSFEEFEALLHFIDKTRKVRAKAILAEAHSKAARLSQEVDVSSGRKSSKGSKVARPAKYRDPKNTENTWSGFGRQPDWMKEYIAHGGNKEDLVIS